MSQDIAPALTPEEWATERFYIPREGDRFTAVVSRSGATLTVSLSVNDEVEFAGADLLALAALALDGQPFGFTHVVSARLRSAALMLREDNDAHDGAPDSLTARTAAFLEEHAAHIDALRRPDTPAPRSGNPTGG
jgi:hypothetical protein